MTNKSLRALLFGARASEPQPITVNINVTQPLASKDDIAEAVLAVLSHAGRVGSGRI